MKSLIAGYNRFRETTWPDRRRLFETLAARGQSPRAAVLACIDSRVDPAMIFDAGPGEILTIRNVANLVPPYQPDGASHGTSAALEFAVCGVQVSELIVLGHGLLLELNGTHLLAQPRCMHRYRLRTVIGHRRQGNAACQQKYRESVECMLHEIFFRA